MTYLQTGNQYINVEGEQIAYRQMGKGQSKLPLLMLVHLAATMDNWDPKLMDQLAQKQEIILFDLNGVGASSGRVAKTIPGMAEQAISFIQALGYKKINLLGLSMGGMISQEVVRQKPDLVHQVILVGTGPRDGNGINKITARTFAYMGRALLTGTDPKRYIFYGHDQEGKEVADQVLKRLASREEAFRDARMKLSSFLRQLAAIKAWSQTGPDDLSFIQQKTLIVNGDDDRMVPTENSRILKERLTSSQLVLYPKAGHGSLFQYSDQFAKLVHAFLEEEVCI